MIIYTLPFKVIDIEDLELNLRNIYGDSFRSFSVWHDHIDFEYEKEIDERGLKDWFNNYVPPVRYPIVKNSIEDRLKELESKFMTMRDDVNQLKDKQK